MCFRPPESEMNDHNICDECGVENPPGEDICRNCGAKLVRKTSLTAPRPASASAVPSAPPVPGAPPIPGAKLSPAAPPVKLPPAAPPLD